MHLIKALLLTALCAAAAEAQRTLICRSHSFCEVPFIGRHGRPVSCGGDRIICHANGLAQRRLSPVTDAVDNTVTTPLSTPQVPAANENEVQFSTQLQNLFGSPNLGGRSNFQLQQEGQAQVQALEALSAQRAAQRRLAQRRQEAPVTTNTFSPSTDAFSPSTAAFSPSTAAAVPSTVAPQPQPLPDLSLAGSSNFTPTDLQNINGSPNLGPRASFQLQRDAQAQVRALEALSAQQRGSSRRILPEPVFNNRGGFLRG